MISCVLFFCISVLTVVNTCAFDAPQTTTAIFLFVHIDGIVSGLRSETRETAQEIAETVSEKTTQFIDLQIDQDIQALELEKSEEPNGLLKRRAEEAIFQLQLIKTKLKHDDVFKQLRNAVEVLGRIYQAKEGGLISTWGFVFSQMVKAHIIKELEREIAVRKITKEQLVEERLSVLEEKQVLEDIWRNQTLKSTTQLLLLNYEQESLVLEGGLTLCIQKLSERVSEQKAVDEIPKY